MSPPAACLRVERKEAEAKRRETQEAHNDFAERLKRFVVRIAETDEKLGLPFCETIKGKVSRFLEEEAYCGQEGTKWLEGC
jgi:hypothetical protein